MSGLQQTRPATVHMGGRSWSSFDAAAVEELFSDSHSHHCAHALVSTALHLQNMSFVNSPHDRRGEVFVPCSALDCGSSPSTLPKLFADDRILVTAVVVNGSKDEDNS